eukprot:jgi/Tetstr1/425293/TSEL_015744.t1
MSLYGDLPSAKDAGGAPPPGGGSSWSGAVSATMLPPPALRKRALGTAGPPATVPAAVRRRPTEPEAGKTAGAAGRPGSAAGGMGSAPASSTEYDPARPNDYQQVRAERERLREQAEAEAEKQAKLREAEERQAQEQRLVASSASAARPPAESRDTALNVSGEEAFLRRGRLSRPGGGGSGDGGGAAMPPPPPLASGLGLGASASGPTPSPGGGGGMSAAARMMAKMGWKEGQGLGRTKQGMITPLVAQKTDTHAGVIINAQPSAPPPGPPQQPTPKKASGVSFQGTPTTIVLLRNMVGPGEVDETLEDEVAEECSKYGQVNRVLIFEFDRTEAAVKALVDLEGRFFGGRVVRATFFTEQRLNANDLAPLPEEIGN